MVEPSELILGVAQAKMGEQVVVTFQKHDPSCTHRLRIRLKNQTVKTIEDLGSSFLWTVPDYTACCSGYGSLSCELLAETYLGGEYLGLRAASLTLLIPDPVKVNAVPLILGKNASLSWRGRAENFSLNLDLILNGHSYFIARNLQGDSADYVPSYELARVIPTLVKTSAQIRCTTKNGDYTVGRVDTPVTLEVPDNEVTRPKFLQAKLVPKKNGLKPPFDRLYIRSKTGLYAAFQVDALYSPMASLTLKAGPREVTITDFTQGFVELPVLDTSGNLTVELIALDQRGCRGRWSKSLQVQPYQAPRVVPWGNAADVICDRADEQGRLSPNGKLLAIRAGKRFSEIRDKGRNLNRCTLRYRIRAAQEPDFGEWIPLIGEDSAENQISTLIRGLVEDLQKSYRIQLSALDSLGEEHRLSFSVMTQAVSFVLYDGVDGAAFGKYPEEPHVVDLAPHMTLRVRGKLEVMGERWRDLGLSSAVDPSGYPHGRHEDTGCYYRLCQGSRMAVSFNCALTLGSQPVPIGKEPIPRELCPQRPVTCVCPREGGLALVTVTKEGAILAQGLGNPGWAGWIDGYIDYYL